ncbi:MAG: acylphosphatase [Methanothrix sp.]
MKRKIEIIGPKVHEVGYRYFLMNQAMLMGVNGFAAQNQLGKNGQQEVWVVIEGSKGPLDAFSTFAQTKRPDDAEVLDVIITDFEGFVPRMVDFALILTAGQIVKAIPIIQEIKGHTAETAESLREDRLARMERDIQAIKARLGMP